MIGFWGEVREVVFGTDTVQQVLVWLESKQQLIRAIYYRYAGHSLQRGDRVLINTSGIDLKLGTGGYGFVMATAQDWLTEHGSPPSVWRDKDKRHGQRPWPYSGRIMKLRYLPSQIPVQTVECEESKVHPLFCQPFTLGGRYVLVGELHSMLPVLAAMIYRWQPERKIVYIMDDQAALHLGLSDHVRRLKQQLRLTTITCGQAVGGELETVNLYTALEAAVKVVKADDIIVTQGPGVVGTRTIRGFSGMQLVHWVHAVTTCGGIPVVIPRIQWRDKRNRHQGLSEHTRYPLVAHTLARARIPYPVGVSAQYGDQHISDQVLEEQMGQLKAKHDVIPVPVRHFQRELVEALEWYGTVRTMGRSYADDPAFFAAIGAVFHFYRKHIAPDGGQS
ncbi:hypothetical protein CathTA2_2018 [Caldalkalibacillus thermarum TA2.A1]|uniref:DUF3866 family protein n=1 Tax=Caldalkalibacillus thermarum (strain TA2.A1) TaxID=986075 RepID=F5L866_CALTT|nr:DUF3866 family protein [Caldalkalibacillus thermarum]EGL82479.1 hypothetical protein CathTA2_2018 [Caldalkalibacillus thermarum TA2.A1]QZT33172.1 DUF3866 family protein [Caldalkalibacillus thermarum TA2.A1]